VLSLFVGALGDRYHRGRIITAGAAYQRCEFAVAQRVLWCVRMQACTLRLTRSAGNRHTAVDCVFCGLWSVEHVRRGTGCAAVASAPAGAAPAAEHCSRGCGSSDEQARAAGAGLCGPVRLRPGAGHAMRDQRDCRPVGGARARPRVWCGADVRVPGCASRASCCGRPQGLVAPWLPEPVLLPCCGLLPGLCLTCARKVVAHLPLE